MPVGYPPLPRYPDGLDDDYTLFLVYNTSETPLAQDNPAWSEDIVIIPQPADKPELWADNGFANINGELFYYDAVDKDANDRVFKLRKCARNLGGAHTQWNPAGTMVRGFVIAEHHNQLVDTIHRVETFVGIAFSEIEPTLDFRIRHLRRIPIIFDDYGCPDVNFTFNIVSENPASGTDANYDISINGDFINFTLDFGDGTQTNSQTTGTHHYAPSSNIDPVITFNTPNCQIVQTPILRNQSDQPQAAEQPEFDIPALPPFEAPPVIIFPFDLPLPDIQLPPLIPPCTSGAIGGIPSVIVFQPPNPLPSQINVSGIPPSITFVNTPSFPSSIPLIAPSSIQLTAIGVSIPIDVTALLGVAIPINPAALIGIAIAIDPTAILVNKLQIDWSGAPTLSVQIVCPGQSSCPSTSSAASATMGYMPLLGGDPFAPPPSEELDVQYDVVGFPSEIRLIPPDDIKVTHDIPDTINVNFPIIPDIRFVVPQFPDIKIVAPEIPSIIRVEGVSIPNIVRIEGVTLPEIITIVSEVKIPDIIMVDGTSIPKSIPVTGIPDTIKIEHNIPDTITINLAEETKKIFQEGLPPVRLKFDTNLTDDLENAQCFALIPCPRK